MNNNKKKFQNDINLMGNEIGMIKEKLKKYEKRNILNNKNKYR